MADPRAEAASEEEEDDDDDVMDDEEYLASLATKVKSGPRCSVLAERWTKDENWVPPVHDKTPAQREQIRAACSRSFMFQALSSDMLETVLSAFYGPHEVEAGQTIIQQGAIVTSEEPGLFIVEAGTLDVYKAQAGDETVGAKVFTYDQAGQSFGELALLYNCPRAATVVASSKAVLWSINRDTFNNCVKAAVQENQIRRENFLASVELLKDLTSNERSKIADVLQSVDCQQGDVIIRQGDTGTDFYILEEGETYAEVEGQGNVKDYCPGDYFGELALLKSQPRAASVIAKTPAKLVKLDVGDFKRLLGPLEDLMQERASAAYGAAAQ